jgi:homocitrate synthase NifV
MDAFRADSVFLKTFARRAACVGAFRLRLADTVGNAAPPAVMRMIAGLADVVGDMALEFHGHNDLGMATANAVCAAIAGARSLSLTVGGLGERAGNAALEEVVMALPLSAGRTCAVDPRRLPDICRFVASISKRAIPVDKPVSGELIFTHESGIHARALLKDELAYQPYAPSAIGRGQSAIVLGKHSGSAVIAQVLARMGYRVDRRTARLLLERVRDRAATNRGCVSIQELLALYEG